MYTLFLLSLLAFNASSLPSINLAPPPSSRIFIRQLTNLQTFSGALGGNSAPAISPSGSADRPFGVDGDTFTTFDAAAQRSCDRQFDACQRSANDGGGFSVNECDQQKDSCKNAQSQAQTQAFEVASENIGPDPEFPAFDLICDA